MPLLPNDKSKLDKSKTKVQEAILIFGQANLKNSINPIRQLVYHDTDFSFLKNIMGESNETLKIEIKNAMNHFLENYGVNFFEAEYSDFKWRLNERVNPNCRFHNIVMYPFKMSDAIALKTWSTQGIPSTNIGIPFNQRNIAKNNNEGIVRSGGIAVKVGKLPIRVHGKFGGQNGVILEAGSMIYFGYYSILFQDGTTRIMHYWSSEPVTSTFDEILQVKRRVFDFNTQLNGLAYGISSTSVVGEIIQGNPFSVDRFPSSSHYGRLTERNNGPVQLDISIVIKLWS